jgi:enoyl-CoA hydratase/carnithine racemase
MWLELRSAVEEISVSDARAIIISSTSDKFFTAGLDRTSTVCHALRMLIFSESD